MNSFIRKILPEKLPDTSTGLKNALREALQSLVLLALWRARFFEHAAFYGGTALRVLYNLDRFSEDLDFSLLKPSENFIIENYGNFICNELKAFGFDVSLHVKQKKGNTAIESAFLKTNTYEYLIDVETPRDIIKNIHPQSRLKIKLEVDTNPPPNFNTELKYIFTPIQYAVRSYTLPSMFAGKIHAMLYRQWKNRVKGRDWYDFVWFISHAPKLNLKHLEERMKQTGHYTLSQPLTMNILKEQLLIAIDKVDIIKAREEVTPFVDNPQYLDIWSKEFFQAAVEQIKPADEE